MRARVFLLFALAIGLTFAATGWSAADKAGQTCGGIGGLQCSKGEACKYPMGECNVADLAGTCVKVPKKCKDGGEPVCGCNGKTYANECELLKANAAPDHPGACSSQPATCKSNADCAANAFCAFAAGACAPPGACAVKPEVCTQQYVPVCGCDNHTYGNDCQRRAAGVSLKSEGECPAP